MSAEEEAVGPLLARGPDVLLCGGGTLRGLLRPRWRANDERVALAAWSGPHAQRFLLAWRVLAAAAMLGVVAAGATVEALRDGPSFLATFSYVSLLEQLLAALLLLCTLSVSLRSRLAAAAAAALAVGASTSVTVVIVFWGLLAPRFEWNQFLVHGVNCLVMVTELLVDRIVLLPVHALLLLAFCLCYFLLVLLPFQLATGEVIYPGLTDFAQPGLLVATLLGIGLANTLFFAGFMVLSHLAKCAPGTDGLLLFRRRGGDQ